MSALRVRVDIDTCCGFGNCAAELPEMFALDPQTDRPRQAAPTAVPPALESAVLLVARQCPTGAIVVDAD